MGRPANLQIRVTSDSQQARGDIRGMETAVTGSLGKLKAAGPALAAAAAAAIGAAFVAGIGKALDQSRIVGKLGAQLGATPKEADRLGKVAGRLFAKGITGDFQTAADSIRSVMQQGLAPSGATEAQLQRIATKASDVTNAFDQDLTRATRAVAQMLRTGISANADEAFDTLTRGLQNGTNASDDLLDTFNEYATQFRDIGINADTALGLLTQGMQAGARDSDVVADALKELNIRVKDLSAAKGLKELGLDAEDMARSFATGGEASAGALDLILDKLNAVEDPLERTRLAVLLLGTKSEDMAQALFGLDPSAAVAALGQVEGASDRLGTSLRDNAGANLDAFKQNAEQKLVNFLGDKVIPTLSRLWRWFDEKLMPIARELGSVYASYLGPILKTLAGKLEEVATKIEGNEDKWRPLWEFIRDHVIPMVSRLVSGALGRLLDILIKTLDVTFAITDQLGKLIGAVQRAIDWLSRLKPPSWISSISDTIGGLFSASAPRNDFGDDAAGNRPTPPREVFAARAATAVRAIGARIMGAPTNVFITIDGQQLQGRITRSISSALQYEGARYTAGGWA